MTNQNIIAFDVDGVLADLHTPWLKRYNKDYGDNLKHEDITHWEMQQFVKPECKDICEYLDAEIYNDVLPIPGALKAVEIARDFGRVIFVTSTPVKQAGIKLTWLNDHGFNVRRHDYVEAKDKSLIRATCLIDDYEENLRDFVGCRVLFSQPWNEHINEQFYTLLRFDNDFREHMQCLDNPQAYDCYCMKNGIVPIYRRQYDQT